MFVCACACTCVCARMYPQPGAQRKVVTILKEEHVPNELGRESFSGGSLEGSGHFGKQGPGAEG